MGGGLRERSNEAHRSRSEGFGDYGHTVRLRRSEVSGITGTEPYRYEFTDSSSSLVIYYREALEPRRAAETGDLGEIGSWANKLDGQIIRLATLLQVVYDADPDSLHPGSCAQNPYKPGTVGAEAASAALLLADYLIAHAQEAHAVMGGTSSSVEHDRARQLLGWLRAGGHEEFTAHDAERSLRRRVTFREQRSVHEACSTLARLGWIRHVPDEPRPGRPTIRFLVHPEVHA
jgi:replicative DNA helicase